MIAVLANMMCAAAQPQARAVPVTMNEMLLRGCTLKNTGHILGLAVYTGNETRIQKNSAKTPNKIGRPLVAVQWIAGADVRNSIDRRCWM